MSSNELKSHLHQNRSVAFKRSLLAMCIMAASGPGFAQTASDDQTDGEVIEEVVVTGMRQALESAQTIKQNADTVVDSITAKDLGSFPDKSVGEALQRVAGITVNRFAASSDTSHFSAEPSGVVVRGLNQVRTEFNGRDSFSANSGRGLSWGDISPELMAGVDTYKNQTAELIEGGIAGTVNMRTRVPFDQDGDLKALTVNYNYGDISKKGTPEISGLYSTRWDTSAGEFGVLGNISYSNVNTASEGAQLNRLSHFRDIYADVPLAYIPDGTNLRESTYDRTRNGVALAVQWQNTDQTLVATMQYNRSQYKNEMKEYVIGTSFGNPAYSKSIYYEFTDPNTAPKPVEGTDDFTFDSNGMFQSGAMLAPLGWWGNPGDETKTAANSAGQAFVPACYTWGGTCDASSAYAKGYVGTFLTSSTRYSENKNVTQDVGFNVKWEASDNVHAVFDVQYVDSSVKNYDISTDFNTFTNPYIDNTGALPKLMLSAPTNINLSPGGYVNPNNYYINDIMDHIEDSSGHEFAFRTDFLFDIENGWAKSLKVGARYADREQDVNWSKYNWQNVANAWTANAAYFNLDKGADAASGFNGYPSAFYTTRKWSSGFGSLSTAEGMGDNNFIVANMDMLSNRKLLAETMSATALGIPGGNGWDPICSNIGDRADETPGSCFRPAEMNQVSEKTDAVYVQFNFGGDDLNLLGKPVSGNLGVRYVRTKLESIGGYSFPEHTTQFDCDPNAAPATGAVIDQQIGCYIQPDDSSFINSGYSLGATSVTHNNLLPSLNIKYEFADEWQARLALSRAMARPDIGNLKRYVGISASLPNELDANDPQWIKDSSGKIVGANVRYTADANNPELRPILADQVDISIENYFAKTGSFTFTAFAKQFHDYIQMSSVVTPYTNNGITRDVIVKKPLNGDGAKISGFEVAYQSFFDFLPEPFNGLGVQTNYTYIHNKGIKNTNVSNVGGDGGSSTNGGQAPDAVQVDALEGLSKHSANLVLMYEYDAWAARLAYSWRSRYLQTAYDCCVSVPIWTESTGQLDGSIKYSLNENIDIAFQVSNLLDEQTVLTQQVTDSSDGGLRLRNAWFHNDRRFTLGLRLKY